MRAPESVTARVVASTRTGGYVAVGQRSTRARAPTLIAPRTITRNTPSLNSSSSTAAPDGPSRSSTSHPKPVDGPSNASPWVTMFPVIRVILRADNASAIGSNVDNTPPRVSESLTLGSPAPITTRSPRNTSPRCVPRNSTGVRQRYSGPSTCMATAPVSNFWFDAGMNSRSASCAWSVSPVVTSTISTPHRALLHAGAPMAESARCRMISRADGGVCTSATGIISGATGSGRCASVGAGTRARPAQPHSIATTTSVPLLSAFMRPPRSCYSTSHLLPDGPSPRARSCAPRRSASAHI